ncbi:MAG: KamA family radical SAM protein [Phycisphaerae bacterium]|nr:KamA family radical SAM protein [Phycisphaerae bacterium]
MVSQSLPVIVVPPADAAPRRVKYLNSLDQLPNISAEDRELMKKVSERYVFRANDYYLRLIDWSDPKDPIRQLIIPRQEELNDWGKLDASNEAANTVESGVQHKYTDTVLLLCNEVCGAYCRYCFRKRLFMNDNEEVSKDVSAGLAYLREHPEVSNVLLTGGDPLIMGTKRLSEIIGALREIDHVKIIRIGSKMPAFNPYRVLEDAELRATFRRYSTAEKRLYLMCHFDHPRELTPEARAGIAALLECGVICVNQCPMIRGINDDPDVLAELFRELSYIGCPQYYMFQGRPTAGNEPFEMPLVRAWEIFSDAVVRESGLAGRARFAMSHASGKVEVLGVDDERMYLRYHRSKYAENQGKVFVCKRNDEAYWLDHLEPVAGSFVPTHVEFGQSAR